MGGFLWRKAILWWIWAFGLFYAGKAFMDWHLPTIGTFLAWAGIIVGIVWVVRLFRRVFGLGDDGESYDYPEMDNRNHHTERTWFNDDREYMEEMADAEQREHEDQGRV